MQFFDCFRDIFRKESFTFTNLLLLYSRERIRLHKEVNVDMRYIWTLIWSLLLSNMMYYVLSSMQGGDFDLLKASIFGVVFAVVISVLGEILPSKSEEV
jgi:hypothetical protein